MVQVYKSLDDLLKASADFFVAKAKEAIQKRGRFNVSLSGGSSPKKLHELLASSYRNAIDWNKLFFFFGDDRYVPADHPDSNYLMAKNTLFDPLGIHKEQIFAINTALPPAESAAAYEKDLSGHFMGLVVFDLIFLGLGDNSHTASLFPHTAVLHEKESLVKEVFLEDQQKWRITLTAPVINQAYDIAFLVYGTDKALAVRHILEDDLNIEEYPAQLIKPTQGKVTWFIDENAARELKEHKLTAK